MHTPQTMPDLLERIEDAIQRVVRAIAPMSPSQMIEPRLSDGRSVKDVLAHLTWWDQWLLYTLPKEPNLPYIFGAPPLFDQIPDGTHWADEMNAKVAAYNKSRELEPIQMEFTATYHQLVQRVKQLTWHDLHEPDGISAQIGYPLAPLILGIYEHYEEHAHEFEALNP